MAYTQGAYMTPEQQAERQSQFRALGYTGEFGGGKADAWANQKYGTADIASLSNAPGVRPLTTASMNPYQQESLYGMGKSFGVVDPKIGGSIGKAESAIDRAGNPYDYGSYKNLVNPYIDEVANRTSDAIRRSYDTSRQGAREELAAAGGFGSTALGGAYGQIAEAQNRQIGDTLANLYSQGYDTATNNAMRLYENDRAGNLARASAYGNIGNQYQNLDQYGRNVGMTEQDRMLAAGNQIQAQNQRELDAYYAERDRQLGYPYQQTQYLGQQLGMMPSTGSTQTSTQPGVGTIPGMIGGGMLGYSLGNAYNQSQLLPWQQSGMLRPSYMGGGVY